MNLRDIVSHSKDKTQFNTLENYFTFCSRYLDFVETGLQARIVSQNESHYQFFQYKEDGNFNITWPLNSRLMLNAISFSGVIAQFNSICKNIKEGKQPSDDLRDMFVKVIYTIQQSIGASLDALPSGMSNQARKVNGDLFERLIRLLIG